jgi:hypothetical protein
MKMSFRYLESEIESLKEELEYHKDCIKDIKGKITDLTRIKKGKSIKPPKRVQSPEHRPTFIVPSGMIRRVA